MNLPCWFCGVQTEDPPSPKNHYCYERIRQMRTTEHLTPVSRGGDDSPGNIVIACMSCNATKKGMTLEEYRDFLFARTPQGKARSSAIEIIAGWPDIPEEFRAALAALVVHIDATYSMPVFFGERQV